jgi:S-DNA-T family DNA segregation ATPase FtsK/SpoIIIE
MFNKKEIKRLEGKIDELTEKIRLISERQNSQYTDIMMQLKNKIDTEIDNRSIEDIYEEVKEDVIESGRISTSYIQRTQKLGYNKASQIMDMLEERGIIGEADGAKPREILVKINEE